MRLDDHVSMCWRMVFRNRRRYVAVLFAIAFGTIGFILIRTLGEAVERQIGGNLELLGEATIIKAYWDEDEQYHPGQFYIRDVNRLRKIPGVTAVAPVVTMDSVSTHFLKRQFNSGLMGVDNSYWRTQTAVRGTGRLIGPSDVVGRRKVCVLGGDVVHYLFGDQDPLNRSLRLGNMSFTVVGTLGGLQHTDTRRSVMMPISTARSLFNGLDQIREIYVRVGQYDQVAKIQQAIADTLKKSHKGYEQAILVRYYPERIKTVKTTVFIVKAFIYAALLATFVLGKVGLTNIMIAAVQERTREIGLKKALGATEQSIRFQFLTESVFISFIAGIVGISVGLGLVMMLSDKFNLAISHYVMSVSVLIDLVFTVSIGIAAGFYPSRQASMLDPVDAMRFE